jgi:hypothetical protein
LLPFHNKRAGLLTPEEPATSSSIAPSAKISPLLVMQRFVAFEPFFALGFVLVLKSNPLLCAAAPRNVAVCRRTNHGIFPEWKRKSVSHDSCFHAPLRSFSRFPHKWQRPDRFGRA